MSAATLTPERTASPVPTYEPPPTPRPPRERLLSLDVFRGMTIAGMLLTDLIVGRPNPWAELYNPSRVTLKATGEFAKETANMAAQYTDFVQPD